MSSDDFLLSVIIYMCLFVLASMLIFIAVLPPTVHGETLEDIESFLVNDTTDTHHYLPYYTCGHFSRDLSYNASLHNISIGSVILGNNPVLRGYNNHIMNYIIIENKIYLIEPQTDEISMLNQTMYNYYRLYPDGTQVPSNWMHNFATKWVELLPQPFTN